MAFTLGSVGVLLAALSDPAELADPNSLSCRITPGDDQSRPGSVAVRAHFWPVSRRHGNRVLGEDKAASQRSV
jgi:hypothetical protein